MFAAGTNGLPIISGTTNSQVISNPDPYNPVINDPQDDSQDFMMLMIEQLKNQDPLNPMDSAEFTTQLAALNSLEAELNIADLLEDSLEGSRLSEATAMIGRYVEGVDVNGSYLTGQVDRVEMIDGVAVLKVGEGMLLVEQVFTIDDQPPVEEEETAETVDEV